LLPPVVRRAPQAPLSLRLWSRARAPPIKGIGAGVGIGVSVVAVGGLRIGVVAIGSDAAVVRCSRSGVVDCGLTDGPWYR
jgi:hypothetical protein